MEEKSVDGMLRDFGAKAIMKLTPDEVETLKDIDTMKMAVASHLLLLNSISRDIATKEQQFFISVYEKHGLDKRLLYKANWRTEELELVE